MNPKNPRQAIRPMTLLALTCFLLVTVNMLFLVLTTNLVQTIHVLQKQLIALEQDRLIVNRSQEMYERYKDDVETISKVFPTEATIADFVTVLEEAAGKVAPGTSVKFNSLTPVVGKDTSYLLLTVSMKTDIVGLVAFLATLETLPYLTQVTAVGAKVPDGINKPSETSVSLKVYVQQPFSAL